MPEKRRKRLSKSIRKHIRIEKARIRREFLDLKEQERQIKELYQRFLPGQESKAVKKEKEIKEKPDLVKKKKRNYNGADGSKKGKIFQKSDKRTDATD